MNEILPQPSDRFERQPTVTVNIQQNPSALVNKVLCPHNALVRIDLRVGTELLYWISHKLAQ